MKKILEELKARQIFRFNWLLLLLVWALVATPWALARSAPAGAVAFVIGFSLLVVGAWAFVFGRAAAALITLRRAGGPNPRAERRPEHLVVLCLYKEPLELIEQTVDSLAAQSVANEMRVVLAFEERSPGLEPKLARLREKYCGSFAGLLFTVHPHGVPGEIAGKCSNVNYAVREAVRVFGLSTPERRDATVVTTCDADNLFNPRHFDTLGLAFASDPERYECVWQAPLFYDWNPGNSSILARNTGMSRSIAMLGALLPLQINTMSIQSLSLRLLVRGNFYHPAYQMEDILNVVRWMTETGRRVPIRRLNIALLSGPTSGRGFREECREWRAQAHRWAIGAAEVFHYFAVRSPKLPLTTAASWGLSFVGYYHVFQMAAPLVLLGAGALAIFTPELGRMEILGVSLAGVLRAMMLFQFACAVVAHALQLAWIRGLGIGESVSARQKCVDLVLTPVTALAYSVVSFVALHEMAVRGKAVCGHDPSAKHALTLVDATATTFPSRQAAG